MVKSKFTLKLNLINLLVMFSIVTFPFYLMPSGLPQISSIFFVIIIITSLIKADKHYYTLFNINTLYLQLFVIYVVIVSLMWIVITNKLSFLKFAVFHVFNYFLFFGFSYILSRYDKTFNNLPKFISISAFIQLILSFGATNNWGDRTTLFFNNPNQLGYYALLSAAILVVYYKNKLTSSFWFYIGIASSLWLAQLSLSTATMLSILILIAYSTFSSIKSFLYFIIFICLGFILFLYYQDIELERFITVFDRINDIGSSSDDSVDGRGYDRIFNHPYILLIGGGEGAFYRWKSVLSESEIHSTFGTILFSYGFLGFSLFLLFLKRIVFSGGMSTLIPFLTIVLYGFTHNGLRFPFFWIFLSICFALLFRSLNSKNIADS